MYLKTTIFGLSVFLFSGVLAQHSNELFNNGALIRVQPGAEIHVNGDVHMVGASATLNNDGLIRTQGNSYSDNLFQQRGTGVYRIENNTVNLGERQFISGSFAVRGGQAQTGVNDGSFYNLELANDQGIVYLVGVGNVADFRNTVDYNSGAIINRVVTHDLGISGPIFYPLNGSYYSAVFGNMNPVFGLSSELDNTVIVNGNTSSVDNAYVQGKLRRAISPSGGVYGYVMGLEPAGAAAQRGVQYIQLTLGANNYDVITGYFESGSPNAGIPTVECGGNLVNYFGGVDHGEWVFSDYTGLGSGSYEVGVWPQDDNLPLASLWVVTKDDQLLGTANDCGPTPIGLDRGGYSGFSEFGVAAVMSMLPIELLEIKAEGIVDHVDVTWNVLSETNVSHYELERSEDGITFSYLTSIEVIGVNNSTQTYVHSDYDVRFFQNYYYRIKNVDFDGYYSYTPVVVASLLTDIINFNESSVNLFPNPSFGNFALSIITSKDRDLTMTVYNSIGQLLQSENFVAESGNTVVNVNADQWPPAVYNIRIEEAESGIIIVKRFVKE